MLQLQGLVGLFTLVALAWGLSESRKDINWRTVVIGLLLQFALALILVELPVSRLLFVWLNNAVLAIEQATMAGTSVVFGYLGGAPLPFEESFPGSSFVLAFRALPLVLVISALSSLLFYWRFLPLVVKGCSSLLQRTLGIGGALGVSAAANVFVGMVEAPLLVRPYLLQMTRGELFAVMTCGMSTIAGTVLVLYASILQPVIPDALGHILTASLISAPAALSVALLMVPHSGELTTGTLKPSLQAQSAMDAIVHGTLEGLKLLLNIIALLIVFIAMVGIVNSCLGLLPFVDGTALTLQRLLGWLFAPLAWAIGIPWHESAVAGSLLGTKTILNELVAYLDLSALGAEDLSERSRLIMTYALCGFANLGSLGIMLGGLGAMAPERREEIVSLGFKSILSGTMATCMTGAVVGLLI
ncbi:MAG: nucleoside:proton symporter [Desulfuromonadales bacterium]|nr:nucleoside:proton symporter [Desulfuromonadales bacterium]MDH3808739.1 nucleoside:proton symporter [Desulfuromonadales bacterium]MDH3867847.1 nucleoside:proton symporter [Desulfuromonadales bacterium]MDH3959776.1 nucleoside:proton symporter [Desulfuromonadales bacterium]MDH4025449.1 nucleoside:proton symporter [Desulfuromonadales bacterium]